MKAKQAQKFLKKRNEVFGGHNQESRAQDKITDTKAFILGWLEWAKSAKAFDHFAYALKHDMSSKQLRTLVSQIPELQEAYEKVFDIFQERSRTMYFEEPHKMNYAIDTYGKFIDYDLKEVYLRNDAIVREKIETYKQIAREKIEAMKEVKEQSNSSNPLVVEMHEFRMIESK